MDWAEDKQESMSLIPRPSNYHNLISALRAETEVTLGTNPQWISSYACGFELQNNSEVITVRTF